VLTLRRSDPVNWRQYSDALPKLPEQPTLEQWHATVAKATAMLDRVDEPDRQMARRVLGDTLIQAGAFLGFIDPQGRGGS
jgi:hypothetical protein